MSMLRGKVQYGRKVVPKRLVVGENPVVIKKGDGTGELSNGQVVKLGEAKPLTALIEIFTNSKSAAKESK